MIQKTLGCYHLVYHGEPICTTTTIQNAVLINAALSRAKKSAPDKQTGDAKKYIEPKDNEISPLNQNGNGIQQRRDDEAVKHP